MAVIHVFVDAEPAEGGQPAEVTITSDELNAMSAAITALQRAEDAAHVNNDKGIMALAVRKDTAASVAGSDGDYTPLITDVNNNLWIRQGVAPPQQKVASSVVTSVTSSLSSATIKTANSAREGLIIHNLANTTMYVKFGATASITSFTVAIASLGYYEMPRPVYTGIIDAIWDGTPTGIAAITEL